MDEAAWTSWRAAHWWGLVGLGIPVWLSSAVHPLLTVALLEVFEASGAAYYGERVKPSVE